MTTTTVTLAQTDGPAVAFELAELLQGEDFAVVDVPVRQPLPAASLLETFPKQVREKALWWEGHILEVLHGLPPGAEPGTSPRPGYGPDRSLTARQRAKAAELTAAGHKVAAQTVANYRRRYQADGVVGLADHRPARKKREFGSVDDAVVAAMRQAIAEATDASTRRGTFLLWRTGEILRSDGSLTARPAGVCRRPSTGCWTSSPGTRTPSVRPRPAGPGPTGPAVSSASCRCSRRAR
ncbi:hypothetical protein [Streptomyces bacillaris]|uniref:hypothetical protein n=1 Tax=Streptomyces bacillaris TaxID=68179 RepID=UPI003661A8A8